MAGLEFFDREIMLATADLEPGAINAALAKFARQELAKAIAAGASPRYEKYVNGREGAAEETVQAPGPILYEFINWPLVLDAVLAELRKRGPRRKSGQFENSYVVIAGGRVPVTDFTKIRADAEIIITNAQPYVRKAEVGRLGIPEQRLFAGTARVMNNRFNGVFRFESRFLNVPSGIHPLMPYRLKTRKRSHDRISRKAGVLTYPSIIINPV